MGNAKGQMKAAIYNPYLDTLGGGERYSMTVAQILARKGWDVDLVWGDKKILANLEKRLGLDLSGIKTRADIGRGAGYDFIFWLSDGSIPLLFARKNILHFQVPFRGVGGRSLFNQIKLLRIHQVVCNSQFTKGFIDKEFGVKSKVVYPPVDVKGLKPGKKEKIILSVGRFSQLLQSKRQDVLVEVFKQMVDQGLKGWSLVLAGGSDVGGRGFLNTLRRATKGYPIKVVEGPDFSKLKKLYAKAKIFWSASGFGVDEKKEPGKVEHFGIVVVEAMASGCVPVVSDKGGHREIVKEGEDGFFWESKRSLKKITLGLIENERRRRKIAQKARKKTGRFSQERFEEEIIKFIS